MPSRGRRATRTTLYDLGFEELRARLVDLGQQPFRAAQIYDWTYQKLVTGYEQMSNLPAELRVSLAESLPMDALTQVHALETDDGETVKFLYNTHDGQLVETVLMFYPDRATVCVSCQVGCAVGCAFCATGLGGLQRNLTAGEMVVQAVSAARLAHERGRPLTNLVMMGMGEPFHNYRETIKFIGILNDKHGMNFGARRITVSTSGILPGIEKLAAEPYQVNLAISLHAPNDELRSQLVPINDRFSIDQLMATARAYIERTGRRISFEYALMKGINDSGEVAEELADLLSGMLCHVNIIPLNPVDVLPYERPETADIDRFAAVLEARGIPTTVRYSRGVEIAAACGQLRAKFQ
ncbi:MAG: 23S rRNA (adenine(2503)-C(2))-methyltransferase RlmN, partial [Thermomicrobiales bacterium]|nr:23S rRNA (adenine(2503)-C(2))-methyltransferase RlmN [Thermomicrobiales bacterium]